MAKAHVQVQTGDREWQRLGLADPFDLPWNVPSFTDHCWWWADKNNLVIYWGYLEDGEGGEADEVQAEVFTGPKGRKLFEAALADWEKMTLQAA